jgi:hypothetical protein
MRGFRRSGNKVMRNLKNKKSFSQRLACMQREIEREREREKE